MKFLPVKLFVSLVAVLTALSLPCKAQATDSANATTSIWVQSGLGISSLNGPSGLLSFNLQHDQWLFTGRLLGASNNEWFSDDSRSLFEIGALAGIAGTADEKQLFWYSFGAGLSYVSETRCVNNCGILSSQPSVDETTSTIGVPFETQLVWRPFHFAGLGLQGVANLNPEVPFASAHIVLQLGNLR